jgi:hypothetical protein
MRDRDFEEHKKSCAPNALKSSGRVVLSPAAALKYQEANGDYNYHNGYDGHPIHSHLLGMLLLVVLSGYI